MRSVAHPLFRVFLLAVTLALLAAACSSSESDEAADAASETTATDDETAADQTEASESSEDPTTTSALEAQPSVEVEGFGTSPAVPEGFDPALAEALTTIFGAGLSRSSFVTSDRQSLDALADSGDPRVAWPLSDIMRFAGSGEANEILVSAASSVTGLSLGGPGAWGELVDHLIAWDIPAPPDYVDYKRSIFTLVSPDWDPFFDDKATEVDYRHWSWGGVRIDARAFDETDQPCNCIPGADNPDVTDADGGDWYEDDRVVFGVVINGEARAYPRNIMEIREMVNDTLGGRDIAMPYCTLCGAAQVYYTDQLPEGVERPVMRTSGLLTRSNKVMYDVTSWSVFDTFLGKAVTGPLAEIGLQLEQAPVITTTWGEWKAEHPDTTILDESLALGRDSDLLSTRDANGPIFPIGDVDPRLAVQEPVLGVLSADGTPIAFPVEAARSALLDGNDVGFEDVSIKLSGGGIRAVGADDVELGSHQAFWFAWSQFHPETELWTQDAG